MAAPRKPKLNPPEYTLWAKVKNSSGNYIDARNANWSMMVSPSATFSPAAAQALIAALASNPPSALGVQEAQVINGTPVPEPTTVAIWATGLLAAVVLGRKRAG